jgi:flagellar biosynthesis/type III secretory pathway chaperone
LVLNENKDTLTISKLLDKLKDTVQESKKLREIQQKIQALISELKRVNDQNRILLNQSIEMIDYTINAIQSKYSYTTNDYSQRGQVQDLEGKSFFDAKQ